MRHDATLSLPFSHTSGPMQWRLSVKTLSTALFRLAMLVVAFACLVHADTGIAQPPAATPNDNRIPAGALRGGVLQVELELGEMRWIPDEDDGPSLVVYGFSERGKAPQIPGPLVRVPEGTMVE